MADKHDAETAAIAAGTHEPAIDDFGNQYLARKATAFYMHADFVNDHDIAGAKIDVMNLTPEQMAVGIYHLQRSANKVADVLEMQREGLRAQEAKVRADLANGGRGALTSLTGGRKS